MSERSPQTPEELLAAQRAAAAEADKLLGLEPEAGATPTGEPEVAVEAVAEAGAERAEERPSRWQRMMEFLQADAKATGERFNALKGRARAAAGKIMKGLWGERAKETPEEAAVSAGAPEAAPETGKEPTPQFEPIPDLETRLAAARETFIKAEQNQEKYFGLVGTFRGLFGGKAAAKEEYEKARDNYERARAELVGENIKAFLQEETALVDRRTQAATEKKPGLWGKVKDLYKWSGDQNLETWFGWKPEGRFKRALARGVNARTVIGLGLLGASIFAGPVSFIAMGAYGSRAAMRGVGAAIMTEGWLKARAEASRVTVKDDELQQMSFETIPQRLGDMAIGLRMQGKLTSESADYQKLMARYEEILNAQYQHADGASKQLLEASNQRLFNEYQQSQKREKWSRDFRGFTSIAVGVGAAIGIGPVLKYLRGAQDISAAKLSELGAVEAKLGELAAEGPPASVPSDLGAIEARLGELAAEGPPKPPTDLGAIEAQLGEMAAEGLPTPVPSDLGTIEAQLGELVAEGPPTAPSAPGDIEAILAQVEDVKQKLAEVQRFAAEGAVEAKLPETFEYTVQAGEGPIHEARKAISEYIAASGDEKLQGLTKAQRILAEEKLYREAFDVKSGYPIPSDWQVGTKVSFSKGDIEGILNDISGQSPEKVAALGKNLEPFVEKVKWERYDVKKFILTEEPGGEYLRKPWEWDEGIRRVARKAAGVAAEEKVVRARMVPGFGEVVLEEPRYVSIDIEELPPVHEGMYPTPDELPPVHEGMYAPVEEGVTVEELILEPESPGLAAAREAALAQQEAVLSASAERLGRVLSHLDAEEYNAIRGLRISDALRKTFWGMTEETRWPGDANHLDLYRKGEFRDLLARSLESLSPEERAKAAGLTLHEFMKKYYWEMSRLMTPEK